MSEAGVREANKGAKLQEALTAFAIRLNEKELQDQRFETALRAIDTALAETINYMRDRKQGKPSDSNLEQGISSLWREVSQATWNIDDDLSEASMMKGLGWADPDIWRTAEEKGIDVSIEGMVNARRILRQKKSPPISFSAVLASPAHINAGRSVHVAALVLSAAFGISCIYGGIRMIAATGSGETSFNFIGLEFSTKQAGVAAIGLGAAAIILVFRRVLKSLDHLGQI